jgi:hypothetical protein
VADLLENSSVWLEAQRKRHLTRMVVYQRGVAPSPQSVEVAATIGETIFQIDDGAGALLRVESRDYLITAADLVLGGTSVLPQRGDQIRETDALTGQIYVYAVMAPGDEPHWRWSDPYRRTLRVHTKHVDLESAEEA